MNKYAGNVNVINLCNGNTESVADIIRANAMLAANRCKSEYKTAKAQEASYRRNAIDTLLFECKCVDGSLLSREYVEAVVRSLWRKSAREMKA